MNILKQFIKYPYSIWNSNIMIIISILSYILYKVQTKESK